MGERGKAGSFPSWVVGSQWGLRQLLPGEQSSSGLTGRSLPALDSAPLEGFGAHGLEWGSQPEDRFVCTEFGSGLVLSL